MTKTHYHILVNRVQKLRKMAQSAKKQGMSRRAFLQMVGIGGMALTMSQLASKTVAQSPQNIIIIGAGASGITCARQLHDAGHSVIVIEARDRIGGRVWTDTRLDNTPLDLGASWIHGIEDNPVWALVREYGIQTVPTDYDDTILYTADGDNVSDAEIANFEALLDMVLEKIDELREEAEEDLSLRDLIGQALANVRITGEASNALEVALMVGVENEYANSLENLSGYYWDEADGFDGEDVVFPNGYGELFTKMAQGLDIRLNQVVTEIQYSADGATITTQTDTFTADKVVVTVPLGVLKQNKIAFSPTLPTDKQTAINRLGMGALNKVYLLFSDVFWDEETPFFTVNDASVRFLDWLNFYPITGKPILMAFYSGRNQADIEAMDETAIIDEALAVLDNLFDGVEEAYVDGIVTRWGKDPFAYGSYSSYAVGSVPDDREALARPLDGVLYFAGEATRTDHPSTVHGAVMSGYAVADMILDE
ncbi:MAG: FAD-dependent oxidoreductase [Anaerolineae bacterium]|nr:FAD-dependent oxidoreductase [Anaerolineae bacterium]